MEWWSGGVVEWWSGGVVEWWSGGFEEVSRFRKVGRMGRGVADGIWLKAEGLAGRLSRRFQGANLCGWGTQALCPLRGLRARAGVCGPFRPGAAVGSTSSQDSPCGAVGGDFILDRGMPGIILI